MRVVRKNANTHTSGPDAAVPLNICTRKYSSLFLYERGCEKCILLAVETFLGSALLFKGCDLNQFVGLQLPLVLHEFCTQLLQSKETPHKIDPLSSPATFRNFLLRGTLVLCPLKTLRHRALDPSMSHSHLYIGWMRVF